MIPGDYTDNRTKTAAGDWTITGAVELNARLKNWQSRMKKEVAAALYAEALVIQRTSMSRTPVDTGALRASHETTQPDVKSDEISVTIKVGGPAAQYAVHVHEDLEATHRVGQAKFLESAIREAEPYLMKKIMFAVMEA